MAFHSSLVEKDGKTAVSVNDSVTLLGQVIDDSNGQPFFNTDVYLFAQKDGGPWEFYTGQNTGDTGFAAWAVTFPAEGTFTWRMSLSQTDANAPFHSNDWTITVSPAGGINPSPPPTLSLSSTSAVIGGPSIHVTSAGWLPSIPGTPQTAAVYKDGQSTGGGIVIDAQGQISSDYFFRSNVWATPGTYDFSLAGLTPDGRLQETPRISVTVTAQQPLNSSIQFQPATINQGAKAHILLKNWTPGEEVFVKDKAAAANSQSYRFVIDSLGQFEGDTDTALFGDPGTKTIVADGVVSGNHAETPLDIVAAPGGGGGGAGVITIDAPITPYMGKKMGLTGSVLLNGAPIPATYHVHVKVLILTGQIVVKSIFDNYIESTGFQSNGDFAIEIDIPTNVGAGGTNTDTDARIEMFLDTKATPVVNNGGQNRDFVIKSRPITFHISDGTSKLDPDRVPGNISDTTAVHADFGAFGNLDGVPAAGFAMTVILDNAGKWQPIPESIWHTEKAVGNLDLDSHYSYDYKLPAALQKGTAVQFKVVCGSWDLDQKVIISSDAESPILKLRIGDATIGQWVNDHKWWLVGAGVLGIGGYAAYEVISGGGPMTKLTKALVASTAAQVTAHTHTKK